MKKAIIILVVILVAGPFLAPIIAPYIPKAMSAERVRVAFDAAGYTAEGFTQSKFPQRDSVEQWNFRVREYSIELYRYDHEGKIVRNVENLKPDPGMAIVQTMNIAQQLGAAPTKSRPMIPARKRMWMIVVSGPDKAYCQQLIKVFKSS